MKVKVLRTTYDTNIEQLQAFIAVLVCAAGVCLFAYGYLVTTTIMNMVEYRSATSKIASLHAELGNLEARYIALGQTMTVEHAHELGLVDVSSPYFVRIDDARRLTLAR